MELSSDLLCVPVVLHNSRILPELLFSASPHPLTGTSEIHVAPDEAIPNLGVISRDKVLATAKAQHDERVKKIIADARNAGVDQKDIRTNALRG